MSNFHLQEIQSLQNSLREREEYITQLENRLRALWKKNDDDSKHYIGRINRMVMAGDALLSHSHCTNYHEKVAEWNEAKRIKL